MEAPNPGQEKKAATKRQPTMEELRMTFCVKCGIKVEMELTSQGVCWYCTSKARIAAGERS
jgi:putative hemolysin